MLIANRYEATGGAFWGGMAEVHTFTDQHLNRPVMLKRIIKPEDVNRLLDEQKALLSVRSKHVVELLDIVEYDYAGTVEKGLILEYIDGHDLAEGSRVPDAVYTKVLWQIAAGLSDVHAAGVIHRDIKPANIRVDSAGIIKIIDFGLSRQVGIDDKTRSIIGSFGYMAPELQSSKPMSFTPAVDVYAFGATALSLIVPVARQVGATCPALASVVLAGADQRVIDIVAPCLEHDATKRPLITDVRDQLASLLLEGQHRAWLNNNGALTEINNSSPTAKINAGVGSIEIQYTGTNFVVLAASGAVNINNMMVVPGQQVPSSCVIIFGNQGARSRAFVTFDASNPEVVA